eukprot:2047137-Rhodomonas_salina.1
MTIRGGKGERTPDLVADEFGSSSLPSSPSFRPSSRPSFLPCALCYVCSADKVAARGDQAPDPGAASETVGRCAHVRYAAAVSRYGMS